MFATKSKKTINVDTFVLQQAQIDFFFSQRPMYMLKSDEMYRIVDSMIGRGLIIPTEAQKTFMESVK